MQIRTLRRRLRSADVKLRRSVAESAGRYLCLAWPLAPDLVKALDDEDKFVRRHSALALGKLAPGAEAAAPALAGLLGDEDLVLVEHACWALGMIGKGAKPALPALRRAAKARPPGPGEWAQEAARNVRIAAAQAIQRIRADR